MRKLPHSIFSTRDLPEPQRFDAWREDMSLIFDVEDPCFTGEGPFHATFDLYNFGQSVLAELHSSSARYLRPQKKVLGDGLDSVLLQLFLEGECQFGSGRQTTYARRGDIVVFDLSRRVDNFNSSFRHLTMMLPRELIDAVVPDIHRWHGHVIPNENSATRLLREHLVSSFKLAPGFNIQTGRHLESATVSLAAAAMSGRPALAEGEKDKDVEGVLMHQIKRYIRCNLCSEGLSPESLAREFGVSRAQIYRFMEPLGGISGYIRQLRLQQSMTQLCDPILAHLSVSEIAYRCGFSHLTTFNRNFRSAFGMVPGEARQKSMLTQASAPVSDDTQKHPDLRREHHDWFRGSGAAGNLLWAKRS